jgi:hypothetical protein
LWRARPNGTAKSPKVPHRPAEPDRRASSTDPQTWGTFQTAAEAYAALKRVPPDPVWGPIAGIGVVLTVESKIVCIDLDGVLDPAGRLDPRADRIVRRCQSWTEVSPSGRGLHVFLRGSIPAAMKGPGIEVYGFDRFIAVTAIRWSMTPDDVRPGQDYLDTLIARTAVVPRRAYHGTPPPPPTDLSAALVARLHSWSIPTTRLKRWSDGYLAELATCPWADAHTTGPAGAAVAIHASGAFDFRCQHAHCGGRRWRDFRAVMEGR